MKIIWRPEEKDPFYVASNYSSFWTGIFSFDDYLENTIAFLDREKKKYEEKAEELQSQPISDENCWDLEYATFELQGFPELESTILSSFFIMIYSYLESELSQYCFELDRRYPKEIRWKDFKNKNTLTRTQKYLQNVQQINFPDDSSEWCDIREFNRLRNCLVHNQGIVNNSLNDYKKVLQDIKKHSIELVDGRCVISSEFCSEALKVIKNFLYEVGPAKHSNKNN